MFHALRECLKRWWAGLLNPRRFKTFVQLLQLDIKGVVPADQFLQREQPDLVGVQQALALFAQPRLSFLPVTFLGRRPASLSAHFLPGRLDALWVA